MTFARWLLLVVMLAAVALFAFCHAEARADPIVRSVRIGFNDWPRGAKPVRLLLASDIHLGSLAMDVPRLERIVGQINALRPDVVVLAGDFIASHDRPHARRVAPQLIAPLSQLRAPFGVIAVLGNHDFSTEPQRIGAALKAAGVRTLENSAIRVGGVTIAGIGDLFTGHHDIAATLAAARALGGVPVAVSHGDVRDYLKGQIGLMLTGHTHCGQIELRQYGIHNPNMRFLHACGVDRDKDGITITTAGLGTSIVPLRFNAPPDVWVITLGPAAR